MELYQLQLLDYFSEHEKDIYGQPIEWVAYHFHTMQELDRLRREVGRPCWLIRGGHGYLKESAVDAVLPDARFHTVVMALMRSGLSKGLYEGGSIHLDAVMGASGLARCWLAFKPERREDIANRGLIGLKTNSGDGWDYYQWGHPRSWDLLQFLIEINHPHQRRPRPKTRPNQPTTTPSDASKPHFIGKCVAKLSISHTQKV